MAATRKLQFTDGVNPAVTRCVARHVLRTERLVVGLSGGIDSVVLLHALRLAHPLVSALHVHHGLSKNADHWAEFCRRLCDAWSVPFSLVRVQVDLASRAGVEGAAREARHAAYRSVRADWIVLAHHRGDRAETMLFNLLRGTGVRGAGAMPEHRDHLLRPLLDVGRAEILAYARTNGLEWIEDEANRDDRYSRNFLRHRILPYLRERFPAVEERLASAARRFAEAADLLDQLALLDMGSQPPDFPLSLELLLQLPEPRARNVLRYLLAEHQIGIPSEERLNEALRQLLTAAPDRHPAISFGDVRLVRRGRRVELVAATSALIGVDSRPASARVLPPT